MEHRVQGRGHEHVTAEHPSTFELTSDDWLTPAGDCILAVETNSVPADFDPEYVDACRSHEATITAVLAVDGHEAIITGHGHPDLTLTDTRSMVGRTSTYIDDRTIMINADTAAADIDRDLITALQTGADIECILHVD